MGQIGYAWEAAAGVWLDWMTRMSWQVAVLVAVMLAISLLARKASARFRYLLWCLVLLKLCLPPGIAFVTGIGQWFPLTPQAPLQTSTMEALPEATLDEFLPEPSFQAASVAEAPAVVPPAAETVAAAPAVPPPAETVVTMPAEPRPLHLSWSQMAFGIWLVGLLGMVGLLARQYVRLRRHLSGSAPVDDPKVLDAFREAREATGVGSRVRLLTSTGLSSPILIGLVRPRIMLPAGALKDLPPDQLRPVLLHELAHLRRRDLWVNWIQVILQSLYWFHPLVWLANLRLRREREMIVDDIVLSHLGGEREAYGNSLLSVVKQAARKRVLAPGYVGIVETQGSMARRLRRILDANRRLSVRLGWLSAAALIALALLLIPQARPELEAPALAEDQPEAESAAAGDAESAPDTEGENPTAQAEFKATLPSGVTVELVGVSYHPSEGRQWWRPDGSPLGNAPYARVPTAREYKSEGSRELALRVAPDADSGRASDWVKSVATPIPESAESASGMALGDDGRELQLVRGIVAEFLGQPATCTLRVVLAAGHYETIGTCETTRGASAMDNEVAFSPSVAVDAGTMVTVTYHVDRARQLRFIAVDKEGRVRIADESLEAIAGMETRQLTLTFRGLPLSEIKEYRIQAVPVHRVEFQNVSLEPGHETDVQVVVEPAGEPQIAEGASFGPVIERVVYDFEKAERDVVIDLDTGTLFPSLKGLKGDELAWARKTGVDAFCEDDVDGFAGIDMAIVQVSESEWRSMTAEDAKGNHLLALAKPAFPAPMTVRDGEQAATYLFKTREGGIGILQIVDFTTDPLSVKIRYKMVQQTGKPAPPEESWLKPTKFLQDFAPAALLQEVAASYDAETLPSGSGRRTDPDAAIRRWELFVRVSPEDHEGLTNALAQRVSDLLQKTGCSIDGHGRGGDPKKGLRFTFDYSSDATAGDVHIQSFAVKNGYTILVSVHEYRRSQRESAAQVDLQRLISAATPGSVVTIPPGIYRGPIVLDRPLTLKGEDPQKCVLELTGDEPCVVISSREPVTIDSVTIKWQLATSKELEDTACALVVKDGSADIRNCRFIALGSIKRCPSAVRCLGFSNVNLANCRFEGFEYTVNYSGGAEGSIVDCLVLNPGHCGITVFAGSKLEVARNIVTGSGYHGIRCTGGTLLAHDNLIINNKNRGIYLGNKSASGRVSNNVIMGNAAGISAFARTDVTIENNLILGSDYAGLATRDSCPITVRNNVFQENPKGIIVFEEAGRNQVTLGQNSFWKNGTDTENIERPRNSILVDPRFKAPEQGDFLSQADELRANKQGLSDPRIFRALWEKWTGISPDQPKQVPARPEANAAEPA